MIAWIWQAWLRKTRAQREYERLVRERARRHRRF